MKKKKNSFRLEKVVQLKTIFTILGESHLEKIRLIQPVVKLAFCVVLVQQRWTCVL